MNARFVYRGFSVWQAFLALAGLCLASNVGAAESYYLVVFGAQNPRFNFPNSTHSFATFVKAVGDGTDFDQYRTEAVTISWMPATLVIHSLRVSPEAGVLLDLPSSMQWARGAGVRVTMWGPYEVQKEIYERACTRAGLLRGGIITYSAIDRLWRPRTTDCIHAVSSVDVDTGLLRTRTAHGDIASYFLVHHLVRWMIQPEITHDWVLARIGVDPACVCRREFCSRPRDFLPIMAPYYDRSAGIVNNVGGVETPASGDYVLPSADAP